MMDQEREAFQLKIDGAWFYEQNFVPTLFKNWARNTVNDLKLRKSDRLLDIACGTGIVGRMARSWGGKNLHVTACDVNDAMLQVAKEIEPEITWVKGNAQDLPFADRSFDKISCQFGLMFFQDRVKAINEMIRVRKGQGKIIIAIWDVIEANEGYNDLLQIVEGIGEQGIGTVLKAPFDLGKKDEIDDLLNSSNVSTYNIETVKNEVEFPSLTHWIDCDVKASPIADKITDDQYATLLVEAKEKLEKYVTSEGKVKFNMSAHIVTIA